MKDDLPTPEELGEKLKRGEITKEDAIEVMSERARREAFAGLYGPVPGQPGAGRAAASAGAKPRRPWRAVAILAVVLLTALLLLAMLLAASG